MQADSYCRETVPSEENFLSRELNAMLKNPGGTKRKAVELSQNLKSLFEPKSDLTGLVDLWTGQTEKGTFFRSLATKCINCSMKLTKKDYVHVLLVGHLVVPRELWAYILKFRTQIMARLVLWPAMKVLKKLRNLIQDQIRDGAKAYTTIDTEGIVTPDGNLSQKVLGSTIAEFCMHCDPSEMRDYRTEKEVIIEIRVPDHINFEQEVCWSSCIAQNIKCRGLNGDGDVMETCALCLLNHRWLLVLEYLLMLIRTRPGFVLKKLGCNGTWPGWENSPDYDALCHSRHLKRSEEGIAYFDHVVSSFLTENGSLGDFMYPNWTTTTRTVEHVPLPPVWQPAMALAHLLDIAAEASMDESLDMGNDARWDRYQRVDRTYDSPTLSILLNGDVSGNGGEEDYPSLSWRSDPRCHRFQRPRTFGMTDRMRNLQKMHSPFSVRDHKVIHKGFGSSTRHFSEESVLQGPTVMTKAYTWFFNPDRVNPDCPFKRHVPTYNERQNIAWLTATSDDPFEIARQWAAHENSDTTLMKISDNVLAEDLAQLSIARVPDFIKCPGTCSNPATDDPSKQPKVAYTFSGIALDGKYFKKNRIVTTRSEVQSYFAEDSLYRLPIGALFKPVTGQWTYQPGIISRRTGTVDSCWKSPIRDSYHQVVVMPDPDTLKNKRLSHWCHASRFLDNQVVPTVNSRTTRYIQGQLPLAVALLSATFRTSTTPSARWLTYQAAWQEATADHPLSKLATVLDIDGYLVADVWDQMRSDLLPRNDIVEIAESNLTYENARGRWSTWGKHDADHIFQPPIITHHKATWQRQQYVKRKVVEEAATKKQRHSK